jgi:hypothetical protein
VDRRRWLILGAAEAICVAALVLAALMAGTVGARTAAPGQGGSQAAPLVAVADAVRGETARAVR